MTDISIQLRMTIYSSLMAALIAAGAFLAIPIGPVPIVLQNMFVLLAGLLLGGRWGLASVAVYLLAGIIGLPVFAAGKSGPGTIMGPTGGYLISYLPAVFVVGIISEKIGDSFSANKRKRMAVDLIAMLIGTAIIYACGVPWLKNVLGVPWSKALVFGMYPFLIGDGIKIIAACVIAGVLRPIVNSRLEV
ncbi:biotin transporter BioY [bacterium]|nr:biotin transporter BioY [bacterium]